MSWFDDDITWCSQDCDELGCLRNQKNKVNRVGVFSVADFKDTEYCQKNFFKKDVDNEIRV